MTEQKPIPLVQPTVAPWSEVAADLEAAWNNPQVTVGQNGARFEAAICERLGVDNAVMVSSCTAGLMIGLQALDLSGEVIIPPFTWTSTGLALLWNGLTPALADITPGRYTLDPESVEAAITEKTTAIMPVTVFGTPPDVDALADIAERHGLKLFYDSAQGLGTTIDGRAVGTFGDAEVFSMSPTKVATAMEGGVITTNDNALAGRLRQMRDYGKSTDGSGNIELMGLSARQSELHAVTANHSLRKLDEYIESRERLVALYRRNLTGLKGIYFQELPPSCRSTWNYFTIFVRSHEAGVDCETLKKALAHRAIQSKRYFYPAIHHQTVFGDLRERYHGKLPVAEQASNEGLALPLYSHMSEADVLCVCTAVKELLT